MKDEKKPCLKLFLGMLNETMAGLGEFEKG